MIPSQSHHLQQAHTYTDFSGMADLRRMADTDRDAALEAVARQFESLFLQQMMQAMRSANEVFAEGNFLNSNETEFYQEMYDKQLTLSMTQSRSIGIADALVRQLGGGDDEVPRNGDGSRVARSVQDYDRSLPPVSRELPERLEEVDELIEAERSRDSEKPEQVEGLPQRFDSPDEFVSSLLPVAEEVEAESGIPARLMLAQAALETGWGRHMIEGEDGSASHNLFGIKADQRWDGDHVQIMTTEYRDGVPLREQHDFRAYSDYEASFRDYVRFLNDNPRYESVLENADDPARFAHELQAAGYATDPAYGSKIEGIMEGPWMRSALDVGDDGEAQR